VANRGVNAIAALLHENFLAKTTVLLLAAQASPANAGHSQNDVTAYPDLSGVFVYPEKFITNRKYQHASTKLQQRHIPPGVIAPLGKY
jgi:hypothetical protein